MANPSFFALFLCKNGAFNPLNNDRQNCLADVFVHVIIKTRQGMKMPQR